MGMFERLSKKRNDVNPNCYLLENNRIYEAEIKFGLVGGKVEARENLNSIEIISTKSKKQIECKSIEKLIFEKEEGCEIENILSFLPEQKYKIKFSGVESEINQNKYYKIRERLEKAVY